MKGPRAELLLKGFGSAALVAIGVLAALSYTPAPRLPGGLIPPTDRYRAEILRDDFGVPHIYGETDPDVAYGLAYAHAEDDFATIQGALLASRGRLASVYGKSAAANDYMVALLEIQRVVDEGYLRLANDVRDLCEAYAEGLNHYAAQHPDQALADLYPVKGRDVIAGFVHKLPLFFGVDKVLTGMLEGPEDEGSTDEGTHAPDSQTASLFARPTRAVKGSNAIALAPKKTTDGSTVLVVNSHQPLTGPVAWYEVHLHSEQGWNATGGIFPGAPVVLHGHNPNLGWAHTVNRPDLVDAYRLEIDPEDPNRYRLDDQWLELKSSIAEIEVKLWGPFHWTFKREVLASVHGPVMRTDHGTFALRFSGFGELRQVEQWYRMNRASHREEWLEAMAMGAIPMFNTVYADQAGNIGYVYNARLPHRREGFDYGSELPGHRSEAIWSHEGSLPFAELPQVWNPESGFVQNCNNAPFTTTHGPENPSEDHFSPVHGIERRVTNRGLRALQLFGGPGPLSPEQILDRKFDTTYHPSSALIRLLRRAIRLLNSDLSDDSAANSTVTVSSAEVGELIQVLTAFDFETDIQDPHAALVVLSLGPFIEPPVDPTDEQLRQSIHDAARRLKEDFGSLTVPWGEVNRLRRGDVDLPLAGAPDVLHAIYGDPDGDGRLRAMAGDSYVLVATWSADGEVSSQSLHPFGSATLDAGSPHYADQTTLFAERQLKPVLFERSQIEARLERRYRPSDHDLEDRTP